MTDRSLAPLGMRQKQKIAPGHFLPLIEPVAHYPLSLPIIIAHYPLSLPIPTHCLSLTETSLSLLIMAFKQLIHQKISFPLDLLCSLERKNIEKLTLLSTCLTQHSALGNLKCIWIRTSWAFLSWLSLRLWSESPHKLHWIHKHKRSDIVGWPCCHCKNI